MQTSKLCALKDRVFGVVPPSTGKCSLSCSAQHAVRALTCTAVKCRQGGVYKSAPSGVNNLLFLFHLSKSTCLVLRQAVIPFHMCFSPRRVSPLAGLSLPFALVSSTLITTVLRLLGLQLQTGLPALHTTAGCSGHFFQQHVKSWHDFVSRSNRTTCFGTRFKVPICLCKFSHRQQARTKAKFIKKRSGKPRR